MRLIACNLKILELPAINAAVMMIKDVQFRKGSWLSL